VREKLPLFGLAAAAALATYLVQRAGGAVRSTEAFPLVLRVENALVTYVIYIAEMFWPTRLAVFYPYPAAVPAWEAAGAALLLVGFRFWRCAPRAGGLTWRWVGSGMRLRWLR